jgi:hypothetical protein
VAHLAVIGYGTALLAMVVFIADLSLEPRSAWLAGGLAGGAIYALALGVALLPSSIFATLLLGVGLLGLLPFATAWRYGRRALDAWWRSVGSETGGRLTRFALGVIMVLGLPLAAHLHFRRTVEVAVEELLEGDPRGVARLERLRPIGSIVDKSPFALALERDPRDRDDAAVARLAEGYRALTGRVPPWLEDIRD